MDAQLCAIAALTLIFAFMNGANDSATMVASLLSSRALSPRRAVFLAAIMAFLGAMLLGSKVAETLTQGLVRWEVVADISTARVSGTAALAGIFWCGLGWKLGFPTSYTYALLGGWLGGFVGLAGFGSIHWIMVFWIFLAILSAPLLGLGLSWLAIKTLYWAGENFSIQMKDLFRKLEIAGLSLLCLAHGANVVQNSMALWTLAWLARPMDWLYIPWWIRSACSIAFALGILSGFTRTLKTVGFRIFRIGTLHSVCALGVSGVTLLASTLAGFPLSAGQVSSASLLGTGAGVNARLVRWDIGADFLVHWLLTLPSAALLSFFLVKVVQ